MKLLRWFRRALHDEQRNPSTARITFVYTLGLLTVIVWFDILTRFFVIRSVLISGNTLDLAIVGAVPATIYTLLGGLLMAQIGWAGVPRTFQYVAPAITGTTKAIADAAKSAMAKLRAGLDDRYKDDERGGDDR